MNLKLKLSDDMKLAMKAKDAPKVQVLRMLLAELKKKEIDGQKELGDPDVLKAIQTAIKQRRDSVAAFEQGGRADLVEKEKAEIEVLQVYLPTQLSPEQLEGVIDEVIAEIKPEGMKEMGQVIQAVMARVSGQAEGKAISQAVKTKLGAL